MSLSVVEKTLTLSPATPLALEHVADVLGKGVVRFVVESADEVEARLSVSALKSNGVGVRSGLDLTPIPLRHGEEFKVALVIPTGIGAAVGGHAGDAGPVARLMASVCDTLVTHPNVVNASDINEMAPNVWYVEGYTLSRYLLGSVGLRPVRQNRVLVVIDGSADKRYIDAAIDSVNAARSSYGLDCPEVVVLSRPYHLISIFKRERASGAVQHLDQLFDVLSDRAGTYDAVALTSCIEIDPEVRDRYYKGSGINPWGGVEAMLTHAVSHVFGVPCAHAPMMESEEIELYSYENVDARDCAEMVSLAYIQSVLKGLNKAPRLCESSSDVSCLVIPRKCLGIPQLAAGERGIPIIAVADDEAIGIDCTRFVDAIKVENYVEAAGMVAALWEGVSVESLRRPLHRVKVTMERVEDV